VTLFVESVDVRVYLCVRGPWAVYIGLLGLKILIYTAVEATLLYIPKKGLRKDVGFHFTEKRCTDPF
jgi:hypothetical protein